MVAVLVLTPLSLVIARFIAAFLYTFPKADQGVVFKPSWSKSPDPGKFDPVFNAQDQFHKAFKGTNESYANYSQSAVFYSSTVNPATRFVNALIYAVVAGFGAVRIISGSHFTVGQLRPSSIMSTNTPSPLMISPLSCQNSKVPCLRRALV